MKHQNKIYDFGKGWRLVEVYTYPEFESISSEQLKIVESLEQKGIVDHCQCCGAKLKNCYRVEKDGMYKTVGSECINNIMDSVKAEELTKYIKTISNKTKKEFDNRIQIEYFNNMLPELLALCGGMQTVYNYGSIINKTREVYPSQYNKVRNVIEMNHYYTEIIKLIQEIKPDAQPKELTKEEKQQRTEHINNKINEALKKVK